MAADHKPSITLERWWLFDGRLMMAYHFLIGFDKMIKNEKSQNHLI